MPPICEVAAPPQVAAAPQRPRDRGFFENIFGGGEPPRQQQALNAPQPDFQQIPLDATQNPAPRATDDGERSYGAHGGNVAVCVRTCDGGFFPVSYSAGRADPEDLALLCSALCPNTPVSVYSYSGASDIETAVSAEGEPYRAMPTAFRYRTTFDPSCSCKAPHQTWVAALAEAERLITSGGGRHDVVVSEQKAEEMSRPKAAPVPVKAAAKGTAKGDPLTTGVPVTGAVATGAVAPDTQGVREATSGATVPTAGQETAGISAGDGTSATTYSREQGQMKDIVLPSGVKRRVRIIGPKL